MNASSASSSIRHIALLTLAALFAALAIAFCAPSTNAYAGSYKWDGKWGFIVKDDSTAEITRNTDSSLVEAEIPTQVTDENTKITYSVTSLAGEAFSTCSKLESVTINDGLETVGSKAFNYCPKLKKITIPSSVKTIGKKACEECSSLETVYFADGGELSIDDDAFYGCSKLVNLHLPEGLSYMGYRAFYGCTSLKTLTLPSTISSWIGTDYAEYLYGSDVAGLSFAYCTSLETVELGDGLKSLGPCAFIGCTSLKNVTLPSSLETIYYGAFKGCTSLTSIDIPDSVATMYGSVFENCIALASVKLPSSLKTFDVSGNSEMVAGRQFSGCTSLEEISIPASVEGLGYQTFNNCSKLTSVIFNGELKNADRCAFQNCTSLSSITFPDSVTNIGSYTFCGCTALSSFEFPKGVTSVGTNVFMGCTSLTSIEIPSALTLVPDCFVENCTSLTSVVIPDGVTSIGARAFSGCNKLTSLVVPEGVVSVGNYAFAGCPALTALVLPSTLETFGIDVFQNHADNLVIYAPKDSAAATAAAEAGITYATACHVTFDSDGGSSVTAQNLVPGTAAAKPQDPARSGYIFKGWQLDGKDYDFASEVNGNIELKAVWEQEATGPYYIYAAGADVKLSAIAAGDALPAQATADLLDARGNKLASVVVELFWATAAGEPVEAGSAAQVATSYVVTATIKNNWAADVLVSSATKVTFGGASASAQSGPDSAGKLQASYEIRIAGTVDDAIIKFLPSDSGTGPSVSVFIGDKELVYGVDYEFNYIVDQKTGAVSVTVTGIGCMSGQTVVSYTLTPAAVEGVKVKASGKKKAKVSWSAYAGDADGFTIRYATTKAKLASGKGVKTVKVANAAAKAKLIKKLKSGKRYFFQVRAYKKAFDGNTYASSWSKVVRVKVK